MSCEKEGSSSENGGECLYGDKIVHLRVYERLGHKSDSSRRGGLRLSGQDS